MTLKEIENKIDELYDQLDNITANTKSYKEFLEQSKDIRDQLWKLGMEENLLANPVMKDLEDFDKECLMTLESFIAYCESGAFIDSDGFGCYATETQVSDIELVPSHITSGNYRKDFSHICWYNR